jgi:hypothetical protein
MADQFELIFPRVQLNRPEHVVGEPDKLPWKDRETYYAVQSALKLPRFYVPVMDHSSGVAEVFTTPNMSEKQGPPGLLGKSVLVNFWAITHDEPNRICSSKHELQLRQLVSCSFTFIRSRGENQHDNWVLLRRS